MIGDESDISGNLGQRFLCGLRVMKSQGRGRPGSNPIVSGAQKDQIRDVCLDFEKKQPMITEDYSFPNRVSSFIQGKFVLSRSQVLLPLKIHALALLAQNPFPKSLYCPCEKLGRKRCPVLVLHALGKSDRVAELHIRFLENFVFDPF